MSELSEREQDRNRSARGDEDRGTDRPRAMARRSVLRRGAKLVYIVPAVLAAMTAKPAFAFS